MQSVDVSRLVVSDVGNDRTHFGPAAVDALAADIARNGQISPVIVRPAGENLEIVAGETRTRAIRDVLRWETIVVDVRELTDDAAWEIMLAENTVRTNLDPVDEGRAFWRRANDRGWSVAETARRYHVSPGYVADRMALLALCDDVADLVRTRQLPINRAVAMSQLDHGRQRAAVRTGPELPIDQWRKLCAQLLADQSQDSMFDTSSLVQETWDTAASRYVDEMARQRKTAPVAGLVGPSEIAERLGVTRATISQWRRRHADFPAPVTTLGAGRVSPRGTASEGMPIWNWTDVESWAGTTGRLHPR